MSALGQKHTFAVHQPMSALPPKADMVRLAPPGSQSVGVPGLHAGPLDNGTSIGAVWVLNFRTLWPAGRRVLPRFLPPVDCQVEQAIAVIHRLYAAYRGPVSLEDFGSLSHVANDVHPVRPAASQKSGERVLGRVPRH